MLTTEVDAILRCDECRKERDVVSVPISVQGNGTTIALLKEITLPEGWKRVEIDFYKGRYLCPRCARPTAKLVYG